MSDQKETTELVRLYVHDDRKVRVKRVCRHLSTRDERDYIMRDINDQAFERGLRLLEEELNLKSS